MLVSMQDAAEKAGNPRDRHGERASAWTAALCLAGVLHVGLEVLRAVPREKAA